VVSLHDVAPASSRQVARILEALRPRIGTAISAAVIPAAFSQGRGARLAALVRNGCQEIALHGFSHEGTRAGHPLAWLTGNATEFLGLSAGEILARLQRGQDILGQAFGGPASVLVPPAWCCGALTPAVARRGGCHTVVGLTRLMTSRTDRPLAVHSWDCGRFAVAGYAGELLGRVRCFLRAAIPCVVFHPRDLDRKLFARGLAVVDRLLREGCRPATFAELAGGEPDLLQPMCQTT
jgi:hypothetical protein